ncbi:hypothetical protein Ancab_038734 [Ancistrocladus abbreviatus]
MELVIATKDSPGPEASAWVLGGVLEGMDVIQRIDNVKTVRENTSSPCFRVGQTNWRYKSSNGGERLQLPLLKGHSNRNCGVLE